MQQVAQGWVIVGLTGSAATIASITFVSSVPIVVFSMAGGVAADRYDRRRILIVTQLGLATLAFVYAWLVGTDRLTLWFVYALAAVFGIVVAFDLPAMHALVPELVPREHIANAIALNQSIFHGSRLLGPALAGLLIAATSSAMAFFANGLSYFAVILSLLLISTPPQASHRHGGGWSDLKEGLAYIARERDVRAIIGYTGLTTAFVFPLLLPFMPIAVKTIFGGDSRGLGIVMSASGLGAMLGALSLLKVKPHARGRLILLFFGVGAAALATVSFMRSPWAAASAVAVLSFSVSISLGLGTTILQITVPSELRGRVMGVHGLMFTGLMPLAALALGPVADRIGLRGTLRWMACLYALCALPWLLRAKMVRSPELSA
jgi:MFS family permease